MSTKIRYIEAESIALNMAYAEFYGQGRPVGLAFTFIAARKAGDAWTEAEKAEAKYISRQAISDLKNKNLQQLIETEMVPDCAMARRFMATGKGTTEAGYNY